MTVDTTESEATETPLHLQGRDAVIAAAAAEDWRAEAPDYHLSKEVMPKERTTDHAPGSLEAIVEELVKVFEMEVSHKKDPATWVSLVAEHYRGRVNGGPWQNAEEFARIGSYNILIGDNPYYPAGEDFESSHHIFHTAFPGGFFWEVLEVLAGPPTVTFKWRHWGRYTGAYQGHEPTGELIEMTGITIAKVSEDLRILELEHFYDNNKLLGPLAHGCPVRNSAE
ncbi:Predicted ester cyclase [Nocardia otitidiscaviarum]|uniref:Ester cyclase n=1 Tax=Nocardia otitidiscaviarum TaxID=1823 RepID=A0A378YKB4_9NOCA|nr:ester cyclase [Nocardia otitidiscaviarum]MBF6179775.1 ester cyclase [Nocardia otitidiscaviarum]MCP9620852.1 ester cyclase [Nocardia otitidiscaviarum]QDP81639.1 ester cyclase [Nocardia otitidiscaviarum]SUA76990.1 Predicted ester cyclase [Nocardia otitidiscaviarum]